MRSRFNKLIQKSSTETMSKIRLQLKHLPPHLRLHQHRRQGRPQLRLRVFHDALESEASLKQADTAEEGGAPVDPKVAHLGWDELFTGGG